MELTRSTAQRDVTKTVMKYILIFTAVRMCAFSKCILKVIHCKNVSICKKKRENTGKQTKFSQREAKGICFIT